MEREISKGICAFCRREISKAAMSRHLETCKQRATIEAQAEGHGFAQKTKVFHLIVAERVYSPMYWMHLEVAADITLATLDRFLRDIWLECCGHLSAFTIGGLRYCVDDALIDWDTRQKNMHVRLDDVLSLGQTSSYDYDFGSTTELTLKVISAREVEAPAKPIKVLARNIVPFIPCDVCGQPATRVCAQCAYNDEGYVCNSCAAEHECGQEMLSLRVNSPREGVCGYTGPNPAFSYEYV